VAVLPPGSPLAGRDNLGPEDLRGAPLALTPQVWNARPALEAALAEHGQPLPGLVECSSIEMVKRLVEAGLAVSLAPACAVAREAAAGSLALVPWMNGALSAGVLLLHCRERPLSPAAQSLALALREFYAP
jgi:DNA-binding transcriptional LysR family regulator